MSDESAHGSSTRPEALFEVDGDRRMPTPLCGGPWDPRAMHGGPPTLLTGRALADHGDGQDRWWLSRLTVELIKPVPLAPLTVVVEVLRPGRRVEVLDATVIDSDETPVVRARGLRLLRQPGVVGDAEPGLGPAPTVPAAGECELFRHDYERPPGTFYMDAFELRTVDGRSFGPVGPSACWSRLRVPVFAGETIGPLDRLLACSDFGNGVSNVLPAETHTYINPDLTVYIHRHPIGDWVLMDAVTSYDPDGFGTATNILSDTAGRVGVANQSLLVESR